MPEIASRNHIEAISRVTKKALEEALKIPVKETYIYSIYANKAINLEKR